jgi:hypothetical protein
MNSAFLSLAWNYSPNFLTAYSYYTYKECSGILLFFVIRSWFCILCTVNNAKNGKWVQVGLEFY